MLRRRAWLAEAVPSWHSIGLNDQRAPTSPAPAPVHAHAHPHESPKAVLSAVTAFFLWGILPVYWKAAVPIGSAVIVAHRVWGTILFLIPLLRSRGELGA